MKAQKIKARIKEKFNKYLVDRYHADPTYFLPINCDDWRTSKKIEKMSIGQRGLYIELLLIQWIVGKHLPSDPKELIAVIGWISAKDFHELWCPPLTDCFIRRKDEIYNQRLELERELWEDHSDAAYLRVTKDHVAEVEARRNRRFGAIKARERKTNKDSNKQVLIDPLIRNHGEGPYDSTTSKSSSGDMAIVTTEKDLKSKKRSNSSKDLKSKKSNNTVDGEPEDKHEIRGVWAGHLVWSRHEKKLKMSRAFVKHLIDNGVTSEQLNRERGAINRWLTTPKGQKKVNAIVYWSRFVNSWFDKNIRQQQTNKEMRKFRDEKTHGAHTPSYKQPKPQEQRCAKCKMVLPSHKPLCPEEK